VPPDFIFAQLVKPGNPNPQKYKMAIMYIVLEMMNLLPYQKKKRVLWKDATVIIHYSRLITSIT